MLQGGCPLKPKSDLSGPIPRRALAHRLLFPGMSQSAQGNFINQISVIGSDNVSVIVNGQHLIDLEPRAFPLALPESHTEIDLLKAAYAQIPFVGRADLLQDFLAWCDGAPPVSCRIVIGRGGAGKTRFAYELYARVTKLANWKAYFLHFLEGSARGVNLWSEVKSKNGGLAHLCQGPSN